jgi:hypothetical protein
LSGIQRADIASIAFGPGNKGQKDLSEFSLSADASGLGSTLETKAAAKRGSCRGQLLSPLRKFTITQFML